MKKLLLIALTITPLVLHALPKIPDELANYRGQCNSEQAQALGGKSHLTENQILNMTHASIMRRLTPNSPMTMDYRQERISVVYEPNTTKIVKAFCG